ncbi:hypothetical protein GCM10023157_29210 [Gluconacetobacter asukensis]
MLGPQCPGLLGQALDIAPADQSDSAKTLRCLQQQIDRGAPNTAGAAQNGD